MSKELDDFCSYSKESGAKLSFFPQINPDGIALFSIREVGGQTVVENVRTNDFDIQKFNGGEWAESADKFSENTMNLITTLIFLEVSSYCLRNNIEHEVLLLILSPDGKGIFTPIVVAPINFAGIVADANASLDEIGREDYE